MGSDSRDEPSSFEAWVTDLQAPRVDAEESHAFASEKQEHTLRLHATLRRRARLVRGLLLVATIGLPLALLLHEIQAAAAGHALTAGSSPPHTVLAKERPLAPWLAGHRGTTPAAGTLDIQPARMDGDVVYACWVDSPSGSGLYQPAPLHLAVSGDGAYTWRALASPLPRATACHLVPDARDARRITLAAQLETGASAGCSMSRMFASEDSGVHWSAVILPAVLAGACALSLSSVSGTLVLWTTRPPSPTSEIRDTRLWLSLDSEATWRAVGEGLPSGKIESVVSAQADGALLVLVRRGEVASAIATQAPKATSELWSCPPGCPRWHEVARVPGGAPAVFATPGGWLSYAGGWGTVYAVNTAAPPSGSAQALTAPTVGAIYASAEAEAGAWHMLRPPPCLVVESGVSADPASPGPGRIVGVGPDGSLVLESQNAAVTIGSSASMQTESPVSVLSLWGPSKGRWLAPVLIEPAASTALAAVWDEQGANGALRLTIWLGTRSGDVWPMVVPSNAWQVSQAAIRCQRCR